jgi:hypothetical protein
MGLSFHKSIKVGKNTRINLSKHGGIGVSTGVKGARVSVNKQGVRTSVGKDGLYYRKQTSWNKLEGNTKQTQSLTDSEIRNDPETLRSVNQQIFSNTEKKLFTWFVAITILAFIFGAFIGIAGFWIIFVLNCIWFAWFTISGVRYMIRFNKQGKILFKDK